MELTPKQLKRIKKLEKFGEDKDLSTLENLLELDEKIDDKIDEVKTEINTKFNSLQEEVKKKSLELSTLEIDKAELVGDKGEKGDRGEKGEKGDKGDKGDTTIVEKVIEKTEVIHETPIVTEVVKEVAVKDTGEEIISKINEDEKSLIKKEKIEGLDDTLKTNTEDLLNRAVSIVDNRTSFLINKVSNLSEKVDNINPVETQDLQAVTDLGATTTKDITAKSFIKTGGTSSQFLKADGSSDSSTYLTSESDPVFSAWLLATPPLYSETDPVFTAWDKSTGISISESQISDLKAYLTTETDPVWSSEKSGYAQLSGATFTGNISALNLSGTNTGDQTVGTWGALNYPTWASGTPFVKMTAAGTFALDTNTYLTAEADTLQSVTDRGATTTNKIEITTKDSATVPDVTGIALTQVSGSWQAYDPGYYYSYWWQYPGYNRLFFAVYAYTEVLGEKVFSENMYEDYIDVSSSIDPFDITVNITPVAGVDGYLVLYGGRRADYHFSGTYSNSTGGKLTTSTSVTISTTPNDMTMGQMVYFSDDPIYLDGLDVDGSAIVKGNTTLEGEVVISKLGANRIPFANANSKISSDANFTFDSDSTLKVTSQVSVGKNIGTGTAPVGHGIRWSGISGGTVKTIRHEGRLLNISNNMSDDIGVERVTTAPGVAFQLDSRNQYGMFKVYRREANTNALTAPLSITDLQNVNIGGGGGLRENNNQALFWGVPVNNNYALLRLDNSSSQTMFRILIDGKTAIGHGTPSAFLHIIGATEQLRVGFDASNYFSTTVGSTGGVTFDAVGSGSEFIFSDSVRFNGGTKSSDGSVGATGTFTTADSKTVTVKNGIITSIV